MDCSDWSNAIEYQIFDTRPDTEFNLLLVGRWFNYTAHGPAAIKEKVPVSGEFWKHTVTQLTTSHPTGRHRRISIIVDRVPTTLSFLHSGSVGHVETYRQLEDATVSSALTGRS
jgi:hypothetical protein